MNSHIRWLVLQFGREHLTQPLVVSIAVDAIMVVLCAACLVSLRRERPGT